MTSQNSYLIVSPCRSGSTWLNKVIAEHYNIYNTAESLCKFISVPNGYAFDRINKWRQRKC